MTSTARSTSSSGPRKKRFNSIVSDPFGPGPFPPDQPHVPPTTGGTACLTAHSAQRLPDGTSTLSSTRCVPPVHLRGQRPDKRKVTVALGVVQPVADHELIRHLETGVCHVHVHLRR